MSASVLRFLLLSTTFLLGISMVIGTAEGQNRPFSRGHGDPCGDSADQTLVCCLGMTTSTLIYNTEECCNGRPVGPGQICCDDTIPVNLTSSDHDSCCLDPDTLQGTTFLSSQHYCNSETGNIVEIPSRFGHSNALNPFRPSSSLLSSDNSVQEEPPSFDRWCRAGYGYGVSRLLSPRWRGESVRCCDIVPYFASRQTCCDGVLHNAPTEETQCCFDRAYRRGDPSNPCLGRCGGSVFNTEDELCCQGTVHPSTSPSDICCGRDKISSETHLCCRGVAVQREGNYRCCRGVLPYVRPYMKCGRMGQLTRKAKGQFQARAVCGRLPRWDLNWPEIRLQGSRNPLILIEGQVTRVNKTRHSHLRLTLNPVRLSQSASSGGQAPANSSCLENQTFELAVKLRNGGRERKCRGRQLRRYLRHKVLHVFFPLNALDCSDPDAAVVKVPVRSREHLILLASPGM